MAGSLQVNPFGACKNTPGVILHAPGIGSKGKPRHVKLPLGCFYMARPAERTEREQRP